MYVCTQGHRPGLSTNGTLTSKPTHTKIQIQETDNTSLKHAANTIILSDISRWVSNKKYRKFLPNFQKFSTAEEEQSGHL